jgi:hypothetical protein
MELHPVKVVRLAHRRGDPAIGGMRQRLKPFRQLRHLVRMAHQRRLACFQPLEERAVFVKRYFHDAVFAFIAGRNRAAHAVADQLHAVADAEYRDPQLENFPVAARRVGFIDAFRPASEDNAHRRDFLYFFRRNAARLNDGIDVQFTHAACDQILILASEINDDDRLIHTLAPCMAKAFLCNYNYDINKYKLRFQ